MNCITCKNNPPSKKWPCVDCDMRYHDRWEERSIMSAKERVEKEASELREKIDKLGNFLPTEAFEALSELQKDLLYQQYDIMCAYHKVLCTRIKNW